MSEFEEVREYKQDNARRSFRKIIGPNKQTEEEFEEKKAKKKNYFRRTVDEKLLEELAEKDCSIGEMSARLNCDKNVLLDNYSDRIKEGREKGNSLLRGKMYELAMAGNVTLMIWLSKQRLGYTEPKTVTDQSSHIKVEIQEVPSEKKVIEVYSENVVVEKEHIMKPYLGQKPLVDNFKKSK